MNKKLPLREIKKARSKAAIFHACLDLIGDKSFREVRIEEICEKAEVSKVTFFKFFSRKEDLLVYFMCLWLTDVVIELRTQDKHGLDALRYILHKVADGAKEKPGLMLSLIAFLAEENMHPTMPVLSEAEIRILYADAAEGMVGPEPPNLAELFYQYIREGQEQGKITTKLPAEKLVKIMFSIFYGAFLTAHIYQGDVMDFYELHLNLFTT